jgi:hypothetical protein
MKNIFTIILLTLSIGAFSQDILLQQNVKADSVRPTYGPNLKNFFHGYIGIGFPFSTSQESGYTKPVASANFDFGVRYKRRFTNYLAMGMDLGISSVSYRIKQNDSKTVPDITINDKEKILVNALGSSAWLRINVGRRGNYVGNYLDLGAYGDWNFQKKHKTTNTNSDNEKVKISTSKLKYVEDFSYGFLTRVGIGRYALTARYRMSDIFISSYDIPELPRLIVGFEVGLFRK